MASTRLHLTLALLIVGGCAFPVEQAVDHSICGKLDLAVDLDPLASIATSNKTDHLPVDMQGKEIKPKPSMAELLKVPRDIPGSDVPLIKLPPVGSPQEARDKAIDRQLPPLEELGKVLEAPSGPEGRPLTLADLQKLALANNPVLKQMAADVEAARGGAIQARMYPNPTINIATQSMGPGGGPINGGFITQLVKTPGKLSLAYAAAYKDVEMAELHLRQAESDLRTEVRSGYLSVLVARENLKVSRALAQLTDRVFKVMTMQMKGGQTAVYETAQLRVIANQARTAYVQAHHSYLARWKQLATTLGLPGLPLTQLAGSLDRPIPKYEHDNVLAIILNNHTEVLAAKVGMEKAQKVLRIAQVTPIPDFITQLMVQQDNSPGPGPYRVIGLAQFGIALPVFDQNLGGIRQAQGQLVRANEEPHRVRSELASRLADAFSRYEFTRKIVEMYTQDMLPDQVRAFRAVVQRHVFGPPGVSFLDLVSAEQTLVNLVKGYIGSLHDMWFAVVDVASLLQTPDLFQAECTYPVAPIPNLEQLFDLPCLHPCNPWPDGKLFQGDPSWPGHPLEPRPSEAAPPPRVLPEDTKPHGKLGMPLQAPPVNQEPLVQRESVARLQVPAAARTSAASKPVSTEKKE